VLPHGALIVEYESADIRPAAEIIFETGCKRISFQFLFRAIHMPAQIWRELDCRHGGYPLLAARIPYGVRLMSRQFFSGMIAVEISAYCPVNAAWLMPSVKTIQADSGGK
jgi:hypothetical protein